METPDKAASNRVLTALHASRTVLGSGEPLTPEELAEVEHRRFVRSLASIIVMSQHDKRRMVILCDAMARLANENKPFKERLKQRIDTGRKRLLRWTDKRNYWLLAFYWIYKDMQKPGETRGDMLAKLLKDSVCDGLKTVASLENQLSKAMADIAVDVQALPVESRDVALREQAKRPKLAKQKRRAAPSSPTGKVLDDHLRNVWRGEGI